MLNFLVETKQEYTTQLVNVLTPLIYEGLQSIYRESKVNSTPDNILKNFQLFLKRVPLWNNELINQETERIMNNSKSFSWLEDLIKATLKANIIVLTYNPSLKQQNKVDPSMYQNIKINDFIHKIYIECARELWNNPYLLYHDFPPIELKRNQRDTILLIKDCIKEAIRKLLPVKYILQIYLGEDIENDIPDNKFENQISEIEGKNLNKLINKDLYNNPISQPISQPINQPIPQINNPKTEDTATIGSKILNIINNEDIKLTDNKTSSDNNIKNIINNDLNDSDSSVGHHDFQEVFSNSINKEAVMSDVPSHTNPTQKKFFSNYLQF